MKKQIKLWDYAGTILETVGKGALITAKADGVVNPMTIGWGTLGIEWSQPVFIAFVRESRFTKELLDKNPEFTVNIPLGQAPKEILRFCGTKSGRDVNKVEQLGLTLEEPSTISVPGIRELPMTLECKIIYQQDPDPVCFKDDSIAHHYPLNEEGKGDYHTAYYGLVTAAYIIE